MDAILDVALSIPVLIIAGTVAGLMLGLNYLGEKLWKVAKLRKTLVFLESIKQVFPPLLGFGLAWIPLIPVPEPMEGYHRFVFALVGAIAGGLWREFFMLLKSRAKQRGIDINVDLPPKEQRRAKQ